MSAPGIPNPEILDYVNRNHAAVERAVARRMRQLGVSEEMIGIRGMPGVEEGAFTRYHRPQGGGNLRPDHPCVVAKRWRAGINADEAIFDSSFNPLTGESRIVDRGAIRVYQETWANASVRTRLDVVVAHEYAEMLAVATLELRRRFGWEWPHYSAINDAPDSALRISDEARELLRIHRQALSMDRG